MGYRYLPGIALAASLLGGVNAAQAEIQIHVPGATGGPSHMLGLDIARALEAASGDRISVIASNPISASSHVSSAPADGRTLLLADPETEAQLSQQGGSVTLRDTFVEVARVGSRPYALYTGSTGPLPTNAGQVANAIKDGAGFFVHHNLATRACADAMRNYLMLPPSVMMGYRGQAPAIVALTTQPAMFYCAPLLDQVPSGTRLVAISRKSGIQQTTSVPTFAAMDFPMNRVFPTGLFARRDTPKATFDQVQALVTRALQHPDLVVSLRRRQFDLPAAASQAAQAPSDQAGAQTGTPGATQELPPGVQGSGSLPSARVTPLAQKDYLQHLERRDFAAALPGLRAEVQRGDPVAEFLLGTMYERGDGVSRNLVEAVRLFRSAAQKGDDIAQNRLGVMLQNGRGVTKDVAQAARWFRAAAQQGHRRAQSNLAYAYLSGEGVKFDHLKAYFWLSVAGETGAIAVIRWDLTPQQRAAAEALAKEWLPMSPWEQRLVATSASPEQSAGVQGSGMLPSAKVTLRDATAQCDCQRKLGSCQAIVNVRDSQMSRVTNGLSSLVIVGLEPPPGQCVEVTAYLYERAVIGGRARATGHPLYRVIDGPTDVEWRNVSTPASELSYSVGQDDIECYLCARRGSTSVKASDDALAPTAPSGGVHFYGVVMRTSSGEKYLDENAFIGMSIRSPENAAKAACSRFLTLSGMEGGSKEQFQACMTGTRVTLRSPDNNWTYDFLPLRCRETGGFAVGWGVTEGRRNKDYLACGKVNAVEARDDVLAQCRRDNQTTCGFYIAAFGDGSYAGRMGLSSYRSECWGRNAIFNDHIATHMIESLRDSCVKDLDEAVASGRSWRDE